MSDNNVNSGLNIEFETIGEAGMGIMIEPLILVQITNTVAPSILSTSNSVLSTGTETILNKGDDLSTCAQKYCVISYSNDKFDLQVGVTSEGKCRER